MLSLGPTALANAFPRSADSFEEEPVYPLDVYVCEGCSLMQLLDVMEAKLLFGEYIYVSGTSETVAAHNAALARSLVRTRGLGRSDLVIEVASNDGSLLKCFNERGLRTLGIEPAANIAALAKADGIETVNRFFDAVLAHELRDQYGPASVVIANNVLAHVDEPRDFLKGCRTLLDDAGVLVVEVPYVRDLLARVEYDTIYHEHLSYFSATTICRLMADADLAVHRVANLPIHGGSLRICARPSKTGERQPEDVLAALQGEERDGLTRLDTYVRFAKEVERSREATLDLLNSLRAAEAAVGGYGAPAKGNTLLSYCGITTELLPYTVDKNPLKVGRFTPGTHIPVLPTSAIEERRPDYLFLLAWNFADEIMRQQAKFADRGGKFIVPVPLARVLGQ